MLSLSTKTERDGHVWRFRPLPAQGGQDSMEVEETNPQKDVAHVEKKPLKSSSWFGGASKSS